ncbi:MAG: tetratricopeptide (TPR) repeat protein [Pseudohongiellaceae bacterium]|jgi:tetratricopeptide (TPR) repeat protein
MIRRNRSILRSLPWILAAAIIGGVAHRLHLALGQADDSIVAEAGIIRVGDPDHGIPKDPRSALQYLEPLLSRDPEHFQGLLQAARAWADLRNFDQAVAHLDQAAAAARSPGQKVAALRMAVNYLINEDLYDEAIDYAQQVCEIQPTNGALPLQLGAAQYKGSLSAQKSVTSEYVGSDKGSAEFEIERRIEAFVTDLWGTPDVEPLVDFLDADADLLTRETLRQNLTNARDRFLAASQSMADYRYFEGFDAGVAQAYTDSLLRSGRLFEAWIESALALLHDTANITVRQEMLRVQALCAEAMGEPGLAADRYESIVDLWVERRGAWAPPRFLAALLEQRLKDQDWDWLLAQNQRMAKLMSNDPYQRFAKAAALFHSGDLEAALEGIKDPYQLISLGSLMPNSVREEPTRRHHILQTAVEIFAATKDLSSEQNLDLSALDALLMQFPEDQVARRQRIAIQREQGAHEGAMQDALALLTQHTRNGTDFELWRTCANELSAQRYNRSLEERAEELIDSERILRNAALAAAFESSTVNRRSKRMPIRSPSASESFPNQDPALAFAVVLARIERNDLERARNDARQLLQAHPQVQEFRYRLARLLVREGKLEAAVADFLQLLEDVPGDTEALDLALRVEVVLGHHDAASDLVNTMILQNPQGVGAVRYASQQLQREQPLQAARTLERVVAAAGGEASIDVLLMLARARIAAGELNQASGLLMALSALPHHPEEVALVGLELGLAREQDNIVGSAIEILRPLSTGLFPDQIELLCERLITAELYEELLSVFPQENRHLPAVRSALAPLAQAAKALGQVDEADSLLALAHSGRALRDSFILMSLDGRTSEANRRLNLASVPEDQTAEQDLCLAVGGALSGSRTVFDSVPTSYLRELGMDEHFEPESLELIDAMLRLLPYISRLDSVFPAQVVDDPRAAYPHGGGDVERFLSLARENPESAKLAGESLLLMLLMDDRAFWERESLFLAKHVLSLIPSMLAPSLRVAESELAAEHPREALELLAEFLAGGDLNHHGIELFLTATEAYGKEEWGFGLALALATGDDSIHVILGRTLLERGYPKEARDIYEQFLERNPDDADGLYGLIETLASLRFQGELVATISQARTAHPENSALKALSATALTELGSPKPETLAVMEEMAAEMPGELALQATLARAHEGDSERVDALLSGMLKTMAADLVPPGSEEARKRTRMLMHGASTARHSGLLELSRELQLVGMRLDPGNIQIYRELAYIELEEGHLDLARRYLEVLSFVNRGDKEPPLALARLLFEQVGQPHLAAKVIRTAYATTMPLSAVEILAAETYLRGRTTEALQLFHALRSNPLITADTVLNIGRMAYAAEYNDVAALMFEHFLKTASKDHPGRGRVAAFAAACAVSKPTETANLAAQDGGETKVANAASN